MVDCCVKVKSFWRIFYILVFKWVESIIFERNVFWESKRGGVGSFCEMVFLGGRVVYLIVNLVFYIE